MKSETLTVARHSLQSRLLDRRLDISHLVGELGLYENDEGRADELP